MRIIEVVAYRNSWKSDFELEKKLLEEVLSTCDPVVHHIGSTSIPNMAAKPIIDILIEVSSLERLDKVEPQLDQLSYVAKGEYGISGRRYYQKGGRHRTHQIHAFVKGSPNIIKHLAFKHYLIEHSNIASEYEKVKRKGVEVCNNAIADYCAYKNNFIQFYESLAVDWYVHSRCVNSDD